MTVSAILKRLVYLLPALVVIGCHSAETKPAVRSYAAAGEVEAISPDRHLVTIHHQPIAGYMPEMTMQFTVRDERLMDGLVRGDQVDFTLDVTSDDAWVADLRRTGHVDLPPVDTAATAVPPGLRPGDPLPDGAFLAEDGRTVHLSDFRGKVVIFTFFFTRCPLPNYCPLMNRNFAETRKLLTADPAAPQNWQFLSISFDPDFDTPQTLAGYADNYRQHNADRWLFVAAPPDTLGRFAAPLGLIVMRQGNGITHNLRTVVVDPQGRLYRQFNDNLWTAAQLAQAVKDAARGAPGA